MEGEERQVFDIKPVGLLESVVLDEVDTAHDENSMDIDSGDHLPKQIETSNYVILGEDCRNNSQAGYGYNSANSSQTSSRNGSKPQTRNLTVKGMVD